MVESFGDFTINEEDSFNSETGGMREIILLHIRKLSGICCNELTKGYWEERPVKVGGGVSIMRTYKPDQRHAFCNAVDFLNWIVYPTADSPYKEKIDDLELELDNIEKKLKQRQLIFREINLMFERTNYFDSKTGQTERSK